MGASCHDCSISISTFEYPIQGSKFAQGVGAEGMATALENESAKPFSARRAVERRRRQVLSQKAIGARRCHGLGRRKLGLAQGMPCFFARLLDGPVQIDRHLIGRLSPMANFEGWSLRVLLSNHFESFLRAFQTGLNRTWSRKIKAFSCHGGAIFNASRG